MWTGQKDSNTLRWTRIFGKRRKNLLFSEISGYVWTGPKTDIQLLETEQSQNHNYFKKEYKNVTKNETQAAFFA